ncbi:glycosyltransferase [Alisedimentitalea sp. MJ-SS2]|uniref:glycosyltransferase family 2 protein n=1 Tax=Aliisedimentitalea sp. MJ-SS2 TaxID=3049795 RepID=UPI00290C89CA|nr:glycosyltransferase family 2 protein [Alisedimentitalea sp. MJ-SS2]MDU8927160.1 glycosyltransferase [Alisedimentitalea sp. MJ-SS2]
MRQVRHQTGHSHPGEDFSRFLLDAGLVSARDLLTARNTQAHSKSSLDRILVSEGLLSAQSMVTALSRFHGLPRVDLTTAAPDPAIANEVPLQLCLNHSVMPWRHVGGTLHIVASRVEDFTHVLSRLGDDAPPAQLVFAPACEIQAALARMHRDTLTAHASARVCESESCRGWGATQRKRLALTVLGLTLVLLLTWANPVLVFSGLAAWASFTLFIAAALRLAAYVAHMSNPDTPPGSPFRSGNAVVEAQDTRADAPAKLLRVSVLVPLFKETEITRHLIARLNQLTYPKSLLDIVLVLEENDNLTRDTIAQCTLPPWMRVIEVPEGIPKTKPRAMNYALDFCDGDIIGIWDAEDAPEPDQISRVVERFNQLPGNVACLQGILDYYNSRQNWLARCFTVEYAAWFRLILPGMARMGLAIPLGGTTCFFRRESLEKLGGWDAHNVTEDADLGFRLARHGYETRVIATATGEEANCHVWPWIRQRSRWLKGYMVTYLVHMRRPLLFYRQMGAWKFWGFQAHFVTALSQFVLAPFLWSFWLVLLGLPHPLDPLLPRGVLLNVGLAFLMVEVITILINATAVTGPRHRHLLAWVPTLHFYYPLGAIAAYKALYELIAVPFYWDKTQHGHSLTNTKPECDPLTFRTTRIKLEPGHKSL